jgi:hypothetical protein
MTLESFRYSFALLHVFRYKPPHQTFLPSYVSTHPTPLPSNAPLTVAISSTPESRHCIPYLKSKHPYHCKALNIQLAQLSVLCLHMPLRRKFAHFQLTFGIEPCARQVLYIVLNERNHRWNEDIRKVSGELNRVVYRRYARP